MMDLSCSMMQAHDDLCHTGGAVLSIAGEEVPTFGFMVGGIVKTETAKTVTFETIRQFVETNRSVLLRPEHFLGMWQHANGVNLEVCRFIESREIAKMAATVAGENAIWDLANGYEISV